MVDDAFTNHRTAVEQGFSSIKVSPHEGLHWGVWRQELLLRALSTCRLTSRLASLAAVGNAPWAAHLGYPSLLPGALPSVPVASPTPVLPRDSAENVLPRAPTRAPKDGQSKVDPSLMQVVDGAIEQVVDEMFAVDWHRAASQKMESILAARSEDELELHCVGSTSSSSSDAAAAHAATHLRSRTTSLDSIEGRRAAAHAAAIHNAHNAASGGAQPVVLGTGTMPPSPAWGVVEPDALARMQQHAAALAATQGLESKLLAAAQGLDTQGSTAAGTAAGTTYTSPSTAIPSPEDDSDTHTRNASSSSESDLGSHVSHSASSSLSIAFEQLSTVPPEDLPRIEEGSQDGGDTMGPTMVLTDTMAIVPVSTKRTRGWLRGRRAARGSFDERVGVKEGDKVHARLGIVGRAKHWLMRGKMRKGGGGSPTGSVAASDKL